MSDERAWNYRRGASLLHKIRAFSKSGGDVSSNIYDYGITIPKDIAWKFLECKMVISVSGNAIIIQSGCTAFAKEVRVMQNMEEQHGKNILAF